MNVMSILNQVMQQAQGSGSSTSSTDLNSLMKNLSGQLQTGSSGGGGIDVRSLLGGGALGLMLGSKRGRKMGGKALKYGALAGVGMLAWKAYQNHQSGRPAADGGAGSTQGRPLEQLEGKAQEQRGLEILQAMIFAARADGHIDATERAQLGEEIRKLGADDELHRWVQSQFDAPLDAAELAARADSPQAGREIYLVSVIMVDEQNPMERAWLDELAGALRIESGLAREMESQIKAISPA